MKKFYKYFILCLINFLTVVSCSKGGDDSPQPPTPVEIDPPGVATLIFPNENSECTEGTNFTSTQSDVTFDWNDAADASTYQLVLKNLDTQITTNHNSTTSQVKVTISRGTPYSWSVISKNTGTDTAQSSTWKFYNAGEATQSHAPFPADLVAPLMGSNLITTTSTTLEWTGSDVDDDIKEYDVLFGTENPPTSIQSTTTETNATVTVASGNTYYWRIVTKDDQNNTSNSEVFQFKVD